MHDLIYKVDFPYNEASQESYDSLEHGICKPVVNSKLTNGIKAFLTAGQVFEIYNIIEGHGEYTVTPKVIDLTEGHDNPEESEGHDHSGHWLAINGYASDHYEASESSGLDKEVKAMKCAKNYRFFDAPPLRFPKDIIANLQETALPLEEPIMFEKTRSNACSWATGQLVLLTDFTLEGEQAPQNKFLDVTFGNEVYQLHEDVVSWDVEPEDLIEWQSSVPEWNSGPELWEPAVVHWVAGEYCLA